MTHSQGGEAECPAGLHHAGVTAAAARTSPGQTRWRVTQRLSCLSTHWCRLHFLFHPHPCSWYSWRTGAEGGGNLFLGKQLQALAVCARVLLPTNLVWSIISPDKMMRSASRELGVLGLQGWDWDGSPLAGGASRASSQSPLKAVTRTSAGRLNGTWDEAGVDHSQSSELE